VGVPPAEAFVAAEVNLLGWWAPWVGVFLFGLGIFLHFAAPRGSLHWLLLVLYTAWLGERIGSQLAGPYLGAFIGALAITRSPSSPHNAAGRPRSSRSSQPSGSWSRGRWG
jgi:hypothetical protein